MMHGQKYFPASHATHSLNTDPNVIYVISFSNSQCHSNLRWKNKDIEVELSNEMNKPNISRFLVK